MNKKLHEVMQREWDDFEINIQWLKDTFKSLRDELKELKKHKKDKEWNLAAFSAYDIADTLDSLIYWATEVKRDLGTLEYLFEELAEND